MKEFEATQSRKARAKREGDSPRSAEVSGAIAFACGLCGVSVCVGQVGMHALQAVALAARGATPSAACAAIAVWSLLPLLCAAGGGAAATIAQNGGVRIIPVSLKFERLSPVQGIKRLISREAAVAALRACIAVVLALAAAVPTLRSLLAAVQLSAAPAVIASLAFSGALRVGFTIAVIGLLFGGVDFALALRRWEKKLRMSFDELKRDHKEHDGDPLLKGRRRAMHRDLSRTSINRLKDAAFVIVNPTHVAIALEYRPPEIPVPRVLIRAWDESALRVRAAAADLRIPIVENVPLARALYASAKAGDAIPTHTYVAVAEVVAALHRSGALRE